MIDDAIGPALSALVDAVSGLVSIIVRVVLFAVSLLVQLVELLIWSIARRSDHSASRPARRRLSGPTWLEKRSDAALWAQLAVYGTIALLLGGYFVNEHFLKADLTIVSASGHRPHNLEVEWVKKNGKSESGDCHFGRLEYKTYRWQEIRITDPRYQPQTIELTNKDQTIVLHPTAKQALKEKVIAKTGDVAMKVFGRLLESAADDDSPAPKSESEN